MNNAAQTYFNTQVNTVHQGDILLLLYETAIRHLNTAKEKIAEKDMAAKGLLITKTIDIVHALDNSLNSDYGEDLATNLHNLYTLCNARLLQANLKADPEIIDGVISTLSGIRDAFAEVLEDPHAQAVAQQMSAQKSAQKSAYVARQTTSAASAGTGKAVGNSVYQRAAKQADIVDNGGVIRSATHNPVSSTGQQQSANELNPLMFQSVMAQQANQQASQKANTGNTQMQTGTLGQAKPLQSAAKANNPLNTQPLNAQTLGQNLQNQQLLQQNTNTLSSSLTNPLAQNSIPKAPSATLNAKAEPSAPLQETEAKPTSNFVNPLKKTNPLSSPSLKLMQG